MFSRVMSDVTKVKWFTIIVGTLISCYLIHYEVGTNTDGFLYLKLAAVFEQGGLHAAMNVYQWPFFSILISSANKLFGDRQDFLAAGYLVTLFFQGMIAWYMVSIYSLFYQNRRA